MNVIFFTNNEKRERRISELKADCEYLQLRNSKFYSENYKPLLDKINIDYQEIGKLLKSEDDAYQWRDYNLAPGVHEEAYDVSKWSFRVARGLAGLVSTTVASRYLHRVITRHLVTTGVLPQEALIQLYPVGTWPTKFRVLKMGGAVIFTLAVDGLIDTVGEAVKYSLLRDDIHELFKFRKEETKAYKCNEEVENVMLKLLRNVRGKKAGIENIVKNADSLRNVLDMMPASPAKEQLATIVENHKKEIANVESELSGYVNEAKTNLDKIFVLKENNKVDAAEWVINEAEFFLRKRDGDRNSWTEEDDK